MSGRWIRSPASPFWLAGLCAGLLRAWWWGRYAGWEESDYGNLAMTRGVLESGFLHYDMNHLPMYYGLSALVMAVTGDAVWATRLVSWTGGVVTVLGALWIVDRCMGRRCAWWLLPLLVLQPELTLYSASSLREPVYAAALVLAFCALTRERLVWAGALVGCAFLTRMDALLAISPALALHALGRGPRLQRLASCFLPLLGCVLAWSAYCAAVHGTWQFWSHSVNVNLETGSSEESLGGLPWVRAGLEVVLGLGLEVLPSRLGWWPWLGILFSLLFVPWRRHDARRTLAVWTLGLSGFWLGIGLVGQHDPGHNLYWKWLYALLPFQLALACWGCLQALRAAGLWGRAATVCMGLGWLQALFAMGQETLRQAELSERLYRPQLNLARWLEENTPEDSSLLVDNIPGCWLDRRVHQRELWSWFDVPVSPGSREEMARWLDVEEIQWVLWFEEDWTQAPSLAPYLRRGVTVQLEELRLEPRERDEAYGWILYEVMR